MDRRPCRGKLFPTIRYIVCDVKGQILLVNKDSICSGQVVLFCHSVFVGRYLKR